MYAVRKKHTLANCQIYLKALHVLHKCWSSPANPGGGGGALSIYILVGVCRGTSKKGGLRHGHNPKRGVLGMGTTQKRGVLGTGTSQKKEVLGTGTSRKKGGGQGRSSHCCKCARAPTFFYTEMVVLE